MVDHYGAVEDVPVPLFPWHMFICDVGAVNLNESAPGAFKKTIGALSLGRSYGDLGLVVFDPSDSLAPHEFSVKVSMESTGKVDDVRAELGEGIDDLV